MPHVHFVPIHATAHLFSGIEAMKRRSLGVGLPPMGDFKQHLDIKSRGGDVGNELHAEGRDDRQEEGMEQPIPTSLAKTSILSNVRHCTGGVRTFPRSCIVPRTHPQSCNQWFGLEPMSLWCIDRPLFRCLRRPCPIYRISSTCSCLKGMFTASFHVLSLWKD